MKIYLILYGAENEMVTFHADDRAHAIEQFISWAPISHDDGENEDSINEVFVCELASKEN